MNHVHSEVGAETSYMTAWRSKAINKKRSIDEDINVSSRYLTICLWKTPEVLLRLKLMLKADSPVHLYVYGHRLMSQNIVGL
ncbi:3523_t:CDS:1, partial [Ambispora leptoticha]